jgi:hypothetical protein
MRNDCSNIPLSYGHATRVVVTKFVMFQSLHVNTCWFDSRLVSSRPLYLWTSKRSFVRLVIPQWWIWSSSIAGIVAYHVKGCMKPFILACVNYAIKNCNYWLRCITWQWHFTWRVIWSRTVATDNNALREGLHAQELYPLTVTHDVKS